MIFRYKGIDKSGKKVNSQIEAASLEEAKRKLRLNGIVYSSIREEKPLFKDIFKFKWQQKISPKLLATLSRELAMFLKSGIPIANGIKIIANQYKDQKRAYLFLSSVATFIDEGKTLYQALEEQKVYSLPPFYKQSIKVAEDGGILDKVLLELSSFLKNQERINKQIQSSLAYPTFILIVSFFVVGFMLSFIVPKITSIFVQMHQELPLITRIVIESADFIKDNAYLLIFGFFSFVIIFTMLMKFNSRFAKFVDRLMLHLPIFGEIIEKNDLARFAYMNSLLLESGIPFTQAVNLSSNIIKNRVLKDIFLDAAQKIVEGKRLSIALSSNKDYNIENSFIQAVSLGEEASEVAEVLKNISELYFEENRDKTELMLSLLEPVMMLLVGGIIAFIVTAMLLPIFSINIGS